MHEDVLYICLKTKFLTIYEIDLKSLVIWHTFLIVIKSFLQQSI